MADYIIWALTSPVGLTLWTVSNVAIILAAGLAVGNLFRTKRV